MIICTSSSEEVLSRLGLDHCMNVRHEVPSLTEPEHVESVLKKMELKVEDPSAVAAATPFPIGIKDLLLVLEMTKQETGGVITPAVFKVPSLLPALLCIVTSVFMSLHISLFISLSKPLGCVRAFCF